MQQKSINTTISRKPKNESWCGNMLAIVGYTGFNCEVELNPCDSNPCYNGGTCNSLGNNTFDCTCVGSKFIFCPP